MAKMTIDSGNTLFQLAANLVNQSSRNLFLTGKAGTGKTTFLKYIRENSPKSMAVVAPTGVAAINAGGVTIHSFFQLPFSPFIPGSNGFSGTERETVNRNDLLSRLRMTREKIKLLEQLELLIIDEISMVRCDTLDAIDAVLRHTRKRPNEKFGGVQLLLIGDLYQLPPVIKDIEWRMLSGFYETPYFFSAAVIRDEPPVCIEFNKIYRQSEEQFIRLLNQVRNNELDEEAMKILESRYLPSFPRSSGDGYIILTTHNEIARNTNSRELEKIEGNPIIFRAEIEGEFPENAYPADDLLQLKKGAQVMFIKNDSDRGKRYFNGKIGIITELDKDRICVQCKDDTEAIEVEKEEWKNIRYTHNKSTRKMEEEELGSFVQYPLRLAWAITIHKSQGLSFEKAIIDAGEAFAAGQVYVALSRCTSLEGMVLQTRIRPNSLFTDRRIVGFSKNHASPGSLQKQWEEARRNYMEESLIGVFDFREANNSARELQEYITTNAPSFNREILGWIDELITKLSVLQDTADKFHRWVKSQFLLPVSPEENKLLIERSARAGIHFSKELDQLIEYLKQSPAVTDSRLHAKEYNDGIKEVFSELAVKRFLLQDYDGSPEVEGWQNRRKSFVMPSFPVNAYAGAGQQQTDSPHPTLHFQLRKLRDNICSWKDLPVYIVAGSKTIDEMARYLPQTLADLRKINGFGDAKIEQYGQEFLDIILDYCKKNNLSSLIHEKSSAKETRKTGSEKKPKTDTKAESYRLYKEGMRINEIAAVRKLTPQTIEGHLSHYISAGEIPIEELVSAERIAAIEPAIKNFDGTSLSALKEKLNPEISFGEIKMVLAWYKRHNGKPEE